MNACELKNLIAKIVGLRLNFIGCACEMLMFGFENNEMSYAIHGQCLTRIIKNGDILLTTLDYQSWDGEHEENNDEYYNLSKYKMEIEGGKVLSVDVDPLFDVIITLDNGVTIQLLIQNGYSHYDEEREQYRFFEISPDDTDVVREKLHHHYVVYSKYIEIQ
ncbi:MAG: hypothetical protein ACI3XQ_00065 [Eubacteriales bacterium]